MLDQGEVKQYWESRSPALAMMLDLMDQREAWVSDQDGSVLDEGLKQIGQKMHDFPWDAIPTESIMRVLAYARSSRAIRITQIMERQAPDAFVALSTMAHRNPDDPECNVNRMRLTLIARSAALLQVFSRERLKLLIECLEEVHARDHYE